MSVRNRDESVTRAGDARSEHLVVTRCPDSTGPTPGRRPGVRLRYPGAGTDAARPCEVIR